MLFCIRRDGLSDGGIDVTAGHQLAAFVDKQSVGAKVVGDGGHIQHRAIRDDRRAFDGDIVGGFVHEDAGVEVAHATHISIQLDALTIGRGLVIAESSLVTIGVESQIWAARANNVDLVIIHIIGNVIHEGFFFILIQTI